MEIEKKDITQIKLTELDALDPITIYIEDIEPGRGKLTFECYGKTWTGFWGGTGCDTLIEFLLSCNDDYIANRVWDHANEQEILDYTKLTELVRAEVISNRRLGFIEKGFAREAYDISCWEDCCPKHSYDEWSAPMFIDGDDFKEFIEYGLNEIHIPTCNSHDYNYLLRIIAAIRAAFVKLQEPEIPIVQKRCSRCGESKNPDEFHVRTKSKDGFNAACKSCISNYDEERDTAPHRIERRIKKVAIKNKCSAWVSTPLI